jgi:hypothetical protein
MAAINQNLDRMRPASPTIGPIPDARPMYGPARPGPVASVVTEAGQTGSVGPGRFSGIKGMMKSKNFKRNALIGAGVVAAASVVQSRRGDGTSKGRQSNYRY